MVGTEDKYTLATLKKAVSAVKEDGMSYGAVARLFGIPKPTLYRKFSETVVEIKKPGPAQVLIPDEETALAQQCILLAKIGFPIRNDFLQEEVKKILKTDGRENPFENSRPGKGWVRYFMKRNSQLAFRKPEALTKQREVSEEKIRGWFEEIGLILQE